MALITSSLEHSGSIGGGRIHVFKVTGDGTVVRLNTGMLDPKVCWVEIVDDTTVHLYSGTSVTISGVSVIWNQVPTSTKYHYVTVLGF